MKPLRALILALTAAAFGPALAQQDISGTWSGMLPAGPDTSLEIHFVISSDGDGYSTVLTSPQAGGIQDMPATSTSFDGSQLVLTVDPLSGRYEGTFADGQFSGNWIQQGTEIPLELSPYVERVLTDADKAALDGSWVGELTIQGVTLAIVYRFEENDAGEFVGFLDSPDQGANGIPLANISIVDGRLRFAIPQISGEYSAVLDGDTMTGTFTQIGSPAELNMTRGDYVQRGIELSSDAIERLEGSWVGSVTNPAGGSVAIVFRFERTEDGGVAAFLDSPDQGATGIPVSEVTLDGNALALVIPAAQASFTAELSADAMTGNWAQGNSSQPVTMNRGEYQPTVAALDLSDAAFGQLAGVWRGEMGPLEIVFRFETTGDGSRVAFLDVPAQGAEGLSVSEVSLDGDQIALGIPALQVNVTGTLAGDEITAQWAQGPANNPLTLTRDP